MVALGTEERCERRVGGRDERQFRSRTDDHAALRVDLRVSLGGSLYICSRRLIKQIGAEIVLGGRIGVVTLPVDRIDADRAVTDNGVVYVFCFRDLRCSTIR